jgi:uncharacterized membrane protein
MFLILLALAVVGLLIWLPIHTLVLAARLRRLGERLARIEAGGSAAIAQPDAASEPVPLATPVTPAETPSHWQPPPRPAAAPLGPTPAPADQNRPLVVSAERFGAVLGWLARNWVYVVSAVSLALAAIFLLQYGVEHGLLPPAARVAAAMVLGLALVAAGEWLRRQHGDGARQVTAYLPSTFAGAGIVALFASVIAARQLYGLIGPELAFAGLVAIAALALVLGWLYGPWLAAIGLVGATAAPFLVGGASDVIWWLFPYFALIAATRRAAGPGFRRWHWRLAMRAAQWRWRVAARRAGSRRCSAASPSLPSRCRRCGSGQSMRVPWYPTGSGANRRNGPPSRCGSPRACFWPPA